MYSGKIAVPPGGGGIRIFNTFFNALVSADKGYTPLNLSDNIISDIVEPNIPDTIANIKQKSLHGRYFKELEQSEINIQASHAWLKKLNIHPETEGFTFAIQDRVINTRNYKKTVAARDQIEWEGTLGSIRIVPNTFLLLSISMSVPVNTVFLD
jgi:hypothetical protein